MTKGRVAVGKIESWLPEFESSGKKARQKGTGAWETATAPARKLRDMGFEIQHLLWIWLAIPHRIDLRFRWALHIFQFNAYC
jgi:hypothetical protein